MLGYASYSSRREYGSRSFKRYTSNDIAHAWAHQESANGRCPSSMTFEGRKFFSYQTCIAEIVEHNGQTIYLVSAGTYSNTTAQHLYSVRRAIGYDSPRMIEVPGVDQGDSDLADFHRIFGTLQKQANRKVEESAEAVQERKRSRLLIEAYEIVCKMQRLAKFFHLPLDEYPVRIPAPHRAIAGDEVYVAIIGLRLGKPSPWMDFPETSIEALQAADEAVVPEYRDVCVRTRPASVQLSFPEVAA